MGGREGKTSNGGEKNGNLTHTSLPHLKKTMEIIPEVLFLQ